MRLALPSLILFVYVLASFVLPLPCRPAGRLAAGALILVAALKYALYQQFGGAFFAPDLPRPLLLIMEALFASLVILVFLLLVKDVIALTLWASRRLGTNWRLPFTPAARSAGLAIAALGLGAYGAWQAVRVPDVRTVELALPHLPAGLDGFTLVQMSDIHIGPLLKRDWLQAVVEKSNALEPDAVVITGDFLDGTAAELAGELAPLGELRARHGVFGVTGNHEYYYHVEDWLPVFAALGIDMLHNEHRVLPHDGEKMVIAGLPDHAERQFGGEGPNLDKALAGAPDAVRVLLAHQPRDAARHGAVDLQLSGHTHGGLLFFLKPLLAFFNQGFVNGLYPVNDMRLYVQPGTGLWNGFSCRVGVPSEITRLVLRRG